MHRGGSCFIPKKRLDIKLICDLLSNMGKGGVHGPMVIPGLRAPKRIADIFSAMRFCVHQRNNSVTCLACCENSSIKIKNFPETVEKNHII